MCIRVKFGPHDSFVFKNVSGLIIKLFYYLKEVGRIYIFHPFILFIFTHWQFLMLELTVKSKSVRNVYFSYK